MSTIAWAQYPTIPAPFTVYHQQYLQSDETDAHGNPIASFGPWVARPVQSINDFGNAAHRADDREIVDSTLSNRTDVDIELGVPDVTVYHERDIVIVGAEGVDSNGNPVGGTAYHVDGPPSDNRQSPFPLLNNLLGGGLVVRRVT